MIIGTGLDMVSTDRIKQAYLNRKAFSRRILTEKELAIFTDLKEKRQIEFLAGRFAAKEAYAKAKGCGIGRSLSFQHIEILPAVTGSPQLTDITTEDPDITNHLSITHTGDLAAAQVVIEKLDSPVK